VDDNVRDNLLATPRRKVNKYRIHRLVTEVFILPSSKITHSEGWLGLNPGYLLGRVGWGNAPRPVL
jgi:hypothetical protein